MSYKSRERNRKTTYQRAVSAARSKHSPQTAAKYYLRHAKHDCRCAACGCKLRKDAEMVYRHSGPVTLCVACADNDPLVTYKPSAAWEATKVTEVKRKAAKARKKPTWQPEEGSS